MAGIFTPGMPTLAPGATTGNESFPVDTNLTSGLVPESAAISGNTLGLGWQTVAAAGSTQGAATVIGSTAYNVVVSVTASTEGIKLPAATTGLQFRILVSPTVGVKVYPATGGILGAAATNAALAVPKNTGIVFVAVDKTHWRFVGGTTT